MKKDHIEVLDEASRDIVNLKGPFYGDLVKGHILDKIAKQRQKKEYEIRINKNLKYDYSQKGWFHKKQLKRDIIMYKPKKFDELLEDELWALFRRLGFTEMNKDRYFKIQAGSSPKQIDVFAKDDNHVFVIFCTSNKSICIKDEIRKISDLRKDISFSIKKYYDNKFRISYILATRNLIWNKTDETLADEKNIFYWKDEDLDAYKILVEQLGHAAKYQMYSLLFKEKEASEVRDIKVPAMYGGKGNEKYYCFLIHPENLFKIAYVHRREKSNPKEIKNTYQRMVSKNRIDKIARHIDGAESKSNSFPNNVIIAFKKEPIFEPHPKVKKVSEITYGILKFPPFYGCAWIIDGQHRLYGYSKSKHSKDHTLPVIAFKSLSVKNQANLFVDINQEQKSVNKNLLWDLYPDIYEDSPDKDQQILRTISLIAKELNFNENSIFYNRVQIPSLLIENKKEANLTLTNICDAIKENKLVGEEEDLLFYKDYEETIDFAAKRIKSFFKKVGGDLKENWDKGDKGLVRTNVGIRIFFNIFRQFLIQLNHQGKKNYYKKSDLNDFENEIETSLKLLFSKVKNMRGNELDEIRKGSTKGLVFKNTQKLLWDMKQQFNFGVELWRDGGWTPDIPKDESDENIRNLLENTEKSMREIIISRLIKNYGDKNWWKQGIPLGIREQIKEKIENQIKKEKWREGELSKIGPDRKIKGFSDTPHLREVIEFTQNWSFFKILFIEDKEYTMTMFKAFEFIRHKYQHFVEHELDDVSKNLGYWGMKWIRKCVSLDTPDKINF